MNHRISGIIGLHKLLLVAIAFAWFWFMLLFWDRYLDFKLEASSRPWLYLLASVVGVLISSLGSQQEYDIFFGSRHWQSLRKCILFANIQTVLIAFLCFAFVFATKDKSTSRMFLTVLILSFWPTLVLSNFLIPVLLREFFQGSESFKSTILVGNPASVARLEDWIFHYQRKGFLLKGFVTANDVADGGELLEELKIDILGGISELQDVIDEELISRIVIIPDNRMGMWLPSVVEASFKKGCRVLIHNPFADFFDSRIIPVEESGHAFFTFQNEPLENPFNQLLKRSLDLLISIPAVLFILPILTFFVWVMQRSQSPGPILFTQDRVGRAGKHFTIYKFRSMRYVPRDEDDREEEQAKAEDDRIFAFGRFMRKFSIDEFPQFINVLLGDMSVVGPRPFMPCHDVLFSSNFKAYRVRQYVKPGVTGPAQCRGYRGEVTDKEALNQRIEMDFYYVGSWTLWMDIEIIIRTCLQVIFPPKTAY